MGASSNGRAPTRLGEVIETSTVRFWAESDRLNELPPLGSVVRVALPSGDVVLAVVCFGQTSGIDETRRAIRRGSDTVRDDEVYRQHPELAQILRTTFAALPVAYRRDGTLRRMLPPLPPPLHYSVEAVERAELTELTDDLRYLRLIATTTLEVPADQLVAAHVREASAVRGADANWLEEAAGEIARLFKDDYGRLVPILEAIEG